eukprot:CAMPEP_0119072830 /NCGR_PEP_ID=MMETSP1178-20130426/60153_1 /TAXON_ID=33656 /ORGANISM="unid sp, Strain CCMP2000" /LENGTH=127 /DNA_ID=CAMNT_0007054879 /DNA_START=102 /DNA_END=485 /DNA_ORIENTATION=+
MTGRLNAPFEFETELQRIPSIKCAVVTDLQGVVLLRAGSSDEAALQQMAATFALTTDQANKLRLGKTKHFTLCYETMTVVHVACSPLVLTLVCDSNGNVGALLDAAPSLVHSLENVRKSVENTMSQS